jgi:inhibitor of KinA sporulation pathway (predicted exonuclease)
MRPKIIEIGAVEMDLDNLNIIKEQAYIVRPRHLDISKRCSDITGVSRGDLGGAPSFNSVCWTG